MKILVRLPNWLGDMVMSVGLMHQLHSFFPGAEVSVIAKKGIHDLLPFFPPLKHKAVFNKEEYKGISGAWRFGREQRKKEKFDLFFCLPDSFSSAVMAWGTGAGKRIGFKNEFRDLLLTHAYTKPKGLHRAEEYIALLEAFTGKKAAAPQVVLQHSFKKEEHIVVNINSEASSRRLTTGKAVELINEIEKVTDRPITLIGAPKEKAFIDDVYQQLSNKSTIKNLAGQTTLPQLAQVLASARLMLTTDSGPAHLANALGTHTIVLFGAGNEANTAPYNQHLRTIIRLGRLSCEPCEKNVCVRYGIPQCLERLDRQLIAAEAKAVLNTL